VVPSSPLTSFRRGRAACILAVVTVLLAAGRLDAGQAKTVVVFTVDVESNDPFGLPEQIDPVCEDGSKCGLMEIVRLLQARRWPGTFFLNVYENRVWGDALLRDVAAKLQQSGQEVALHTHPESAYDRSRTEMHQYTLDEQTRIVRDGVQLLQEWTGQPVLSHRAGAYGADAHTLTALERNGIRVDSSVFWQYPNSRLGGLGLPRNLPAMHGSLLEVPVTVYTREDRPRLLGRAVAPVSVVRKIDVDWFVDEREMRDAIDQAVAADLPVLVVFLHSFSFLKAKGPESPAADATALRIFRAMLDHLAAKDLPVVTMADLAGRPFSAPTAAADVVPAVAVDVDVPRYVWRRAKAAPVAWAASGAGFVALTVAGFLIVRRRQWRSAPRPTPFDSGIQERLP